MSGSFHKADGGKPRLDMVPRASIVAIARAMAHGANVHGRDNWRECRDVDRMLAAALRHVYAYLDGETKDPDSGLHALDHALASLAIAAHALQELSKERR